jgi:hypothetical protein
MSGILKMFDTTLHLIKVINIPCTDSEAKIKFFNARKNLKFVTTVFFSHELTILLDNRNA